MAQFIKMAGTGANALGQYADGVNAQKNNDFIASQLDKKAKATTAQGTRQAYETRRKGDILASDAVALMAASGGDASDAGMTQRLGDIEAETDYNVLSRLFDSQSQAQGLNLQATAKRIEGKTAKRRGTLRAASTVLSSAGDSGVFN